MITLGCIYCASSRLTPAYQRADGNEIVACQDCGLLFIRDIPDDLSALYGAEYFHKHDTATGQGYSDYASIAPISFRWQLALLRLWAGKNPLERRKLLDLGCANGLFLRLAASAGFGGTGVEISDAAAASVRDQGFPVIASAFETTEVPPCDVITAWDFIEHVRDLHTVFEKVRLTLRPGGVFLFATPDGGSARAKTHGASWICLNSSFEHITYLTRPFLQNALREVFGCDPILLSFDVGDHWTSIVGMVRVGGLTDEDQRISQLLSGQIPTAEEVRRHGAELGYFLASFLQLPKLSDLLDQADGILPESTNAALRGSLLYLSDYHAEALDLLRKGLADEPYLAAWLAAAEERVFAVREQELSAQLVQQKRSMEDRLARVRGENNHLREVNEQMLQSVTWKLGRKITEPIENIPHSRAVLDGLRQLRERGPMRSLSLARDYVEGVAGSAGIPQRLRDRFTRKNKSPEETPSADSAQTPQPIPLASTGFPTQPAVDAVQTKQTQAVLPEPDAILSTDPGRLRSQCLPLVSVILPVYNQTDLLRDSVLSVLSQSYPRIELVILDDGSREDVPAVLSGLLDLPSVRLFRQANQKLPRALSHAFQYARGELLTWTSADNLMHPHAVARLCEALLRSPDAVLAYADVALIDDSGKPLTDGSYRPMYVDPQRPFVTRLTRSDVPLAAENDNYINACFLYRRSASEALGHIYADRLRGAEDYDFWLRLRTAGRLIHIGNEDPLYFYRVHQRSMSHELLTQELAAHHQRICQLTELDSQRQRYAQKRWDVVIDSGLSPKTRSELQDALGQLPVQVLLQAGGAAKNSDRKTLSLLPPSQEPAHTSDFQQFVHVHPGHFALICRTPDSKDSPRSERRIELPRGHNVHPLAIKARDVQKPGPVLPKAASGRPVFAIHFPFQRLQFTVPQLHTLVSGNPWAYFLLINASSERCEELEHLTAELKNVGIVDERPLGEPYTLYAAIDWLLVPPCEPALGIGEQLDLLALSYAIRKPLIIANGHAQLVAPYQFVASEGESSLSFARSLRPDMMQIEVLHSYLESWTQERCLSTLLRHANTFAQDFAVPFPDTGIVPPPDSAPDPVLPLITSSEPLKAAVLVDTLDVGGLEEVVAFLVRNLHHHGVRPTVTCLSHGGHVADKLQREGHQVLVANGDPQRLHMQLQQLSPQIVNSHYASLPALEAANKLGRPIVETIHNTYVWLDAERWKIEAQRSRFFAKGLAVSALVKRYYHAHNPQLAEDKVVVVGNAIDPDRIIPVEQKIARAALGIPMDVTLFLCLGRYCPQKNQLGMIQGFAELAKTVPEAVLLCMGNTPKEEQAYFDKLEALQKSLPCRDRIRFDSYHPDVSTVLSAADVLLMDSFFEGWSLAATEALLTGTPLIHSLCGSAEELCGANSERGFVIPNPGGDIMKLELGPLLEIANRPDQPNIAALHSAMAKAVQKRDEWRRERAAISTYARRMFHPTAILTRYAQTFFSFTRN